jgi:acylglycerol lipase
MVKSSKGIKLFTKNYLVKDAKANLLIVHGLHEHCLRYESFANVANHHKINVYTFDLRGHGQSGGDKFLVRDIHEYREDVENMFGTIPSGLPNFILGHSMGGLITVKFLLFRNRSHINGAILSAPALEIGEDVSPLTVKAVSIIGKYFPNLNTKSIKPELMSHDTKEVTKYIKDPLIKISGTKAGTGLALLNAINELKPGMKNFKYPVLIMHGGDDKITNPQGSLNFYNEAQSTDKKVKIWEKAYHEIFHESNKDEITKYCLDWILERI